MSFEVILTNGLFSLLVVKALPATLKEGIGIEGLTYLFHVPGFRTCNTPCFSTLAWGFPLKSISFSFLSGKFRLISLSRRVSYQSWRKFGGSLTLGGAHKSVPFLFLSSLAFISSYGGELSAVAAGSRSWNAVLVASKRIKLFKLFSP